MRRIVLTALLSLLLALLSAGSAQAASHYVSGFGEPECTVDETTNTVTCTGTQIAGVGDQDATVSLMVHAAATLLCHNPGNDKIVEPHTVDFSEHSGDIVIEPKNGRLIIPEVSVTAAFGEPPTCPNPSWRAEVTDITLLGFHYTLYIGDTLFFEIHQMFHEH